MNRDYSQWGAIVTDSGKELEVEVEIEKNIDGYALDLFYHQYCQFDLTQNGIIARSGNVAIDERTSGMQDKYKKVLISLFDIDDREEDDQNVSIVNLVESAWEVADRDESILDASIKDLEQCLEFLKQKKAKVQS